MTSPQTRQHLIPLYQVMSTQYPRTLSHFPPRKPPPHHFPYQTVCHMKSRARGLTRCSLMQASLFVLTMMSMILMTSQKTRLNLTSLQVMSILSLLTHSPSQLDPPL